MNVSPKTSEEEAKSFAKEEDSPPKTAGAELEEGKEELEEAKETVRSVSSRFLKWTAEDVFDWNPDYAKTVRGILTLLQIVVSALVMIMVGSGCRKDNSFICHTSASFTFVVASAALIQSTLLVICCLLSKKGNSLIKASALELLYYVVFAIFYLLAGLVLETNLRHNDYGHHAILAGGIFALTNCALYILSAIWSFLYFRKHFGGPDEK
ncbi:hypothetical protein JTE90_009051 [Oedothorax gibbosus]|uniref:MARVEL domain-containing protein n=1 Tax=Oedothorax gibbosus TaxID=931172 RepID=A0AAV6VKJ3_9ARAC|nr:hypothetical protein JTE90_009051 [Oedothorax gibbosus]